MQQMRGSNNLEVDDSESAARLAMSSSSSDAQPERLDTEGAAPVPEADHASAGGLADLSAQGTPAAVGDEDKNSDSADDSKAGDALSGEGEEVRRGRRIPPRDMKRLRKTVRYKVVKMDAWGGSPVLTLEDDENPGVSGRYKLPWKHAGTLIALGDTVELLGTAFSESRNLIATEIQVRDPEGKVRESRTGAIGADGGAAKGVRRRWSGSAHMAHKRQCATPQQAAQLAANEAQMRASGGFPHGNYLLALMNAQLAASAGLPPGMAAIDPEQLVAMGGAFHPQFGLLQPSVPMPWGMPFQQLAGGAGAGGAGAGGAGAGVGVGAAAAASAPGAPGPGAAAPLAAAETGTPSAGLAHINAAVAAAQQQMLFGLRVQQEHELAKIKSQELLQAHHKMDNGGGHARSPPQQQQQPPGTGTGAHLAQLPAASRQQLLLTPEVELQQLLNRQQMLMMEPSLMLGAAAMQQHTTQQSKQRQKKSGGAGAKDDE
jgi:hypothetical protein